MLAKLNEYLARVRHTTTETNRLHSDNRLYCTSVFYTAYRPRSPQKITDTFCSSSCESVPLTAECICKYQEKGAMYRMYCVKCSIRNEPIFVKVFGAQESIPPAYEAWRASTRDRVVVLARQAGNRFLESSKDLEIRPLVYLNKTGMKDDRSWSGIFHGILFLLFKS